MSDWPKIPKIFSNICNWLKYFRGVDVWSVAIGSVDSLSLKHVSIDLNRRKTNTLKQTVKPKLQNV
jgi:hypothetical protein